MAKHHNQGINPCLAYAMTRLSHYKGGSILLDPFSKDGSIVIEAARFKAGTIIALDSLFQNLKNSEVNAKLANVKKSIQFSRYDLEWLDVKLEKGSVQHIVTSLPYARHDLKGCEKTYREFFHQADYVLAKDGKIVLAALKPDLLHPEKFNVEEKRIISIGDMHYSILVLKRESS